MNVFEQATALRRGEGGVWHGEPHPAYANMRGPHGGVIAATLLRAVLSDADRIGDPVALTVNFCTAVTDGPFQVEATLQRAGGITQHWLVRLIQDEGVAATATVVCAVRRTTWAHHAARAPSAPAPESVPPLQNPTELNWIDRFSFRFVSGGLPAEPRELDEPGSPYSLVWLDHDPPGPLSFPALAALADVFFLRIFQVRGYRVPMGTVSLTTHFHVAEDELHEMETGSLLGVADARVFNRSFHDQTCELWSASGQLLATGAQIAWFKQ